MHLHSVVSRSDDQVLSVVFPRQPQNRDTCRICCFVETSSSLDSQLSGLTYSCSKGCPFCHPSRPVSRKCSRRRIVISQNTGSISIGKHLRRLVSDLNKVVP